MYSTILFDLDGTLIDPKEGITRSVAYALHHFGIEVEHLDDLLLYIGPPLIPAFMEYHGLNQQQAKEALEKYRERYQKLGIHEQHLYPEIENMLQILKKHQKHLAVATSKPEVFARQILEEHHLSSYFDDIVGSGLDGQFPTKKDVILEVMRRLSVQDKKSVVMIGDRKHDIIGAREASIDSLAVSYGYGSLEELTQEHPKKILHTLDDLVNYILDESKGERT